MFSSGDNVSQTFKDRITTILPFVVFFILLFALTARNPFFLDKDILFSKIAYWLLENGFNPILPDSIDPGYPPLLAYLLATAWIITGKSLILSHAIILPFTIGIIWQMSVFLSVFIPQKNIVPAMLIILADTTFLAQTTVFSTDIVMLFFFLLAINSILRNRRKLLAIAVFGILFSHMRGVSVLIVVFIIDICKNRPKLMFASLIKHIRAYLPGSLFFLSWLGFHYITKGWIGYHRDSPWIDCFEIVNFSGFLRNVLILVWRLLDYGKIFLWIAAFFILVKTMHNHVIKDQNLKFLTLLLILAILVTIPTMLVFKILNGHRYLLVVNMMLSVVVAYLIFTKLHKRNLKLAVIAIIMTGIISGNFWVYPDNIAKGWDASLAYLPYHHLRKQMIRYIEDQNIPFEQIGTESPNTIIFRYIEANDDKRSFGRADLIQDHYVFYSNIFNMFTDKEIDTLKDEWIVEKEFRCVQVYVRLYRNPHWKGQSL